MSQPEATTNPLCASLEPVPTTEHPVRTSSLPAATTTTAPETSIMGVPAIAASVPTNCPSPPVVTTPEGPYDSLIATTIQAARDRQLQQLHFGSSSPLPDNPPVPSSGAPRHTFASIWQEPEVASSAKADRDSSVKAIVATGDDDYK